MLTPTDYDITIYAGSSFDLSLVWKDTGGVPIDLTGYTAHMQMRKTPTAEGVVFDLTNGAGITLGGLAGSIHIELTDEQSAVLTAKEGVYDLVLNPPNGKAFRFLQGGVTVVPGVTRNV